VVYFLTHETASFIADFKIKSMTLFKCSLLFIALCSIMACAKNTPENAEEMLPSGTVVATGTFTGDRHPTSGVVQLIRDAAGKDHLVFRNFRSDNGPDLRVWMSPNNTASSYVEIGVLRAISGNFSYELTLPVNHTVNNRVLIWCEDFSVLFGYAVLQ
jgi:hypothetical protein